MTLLRNLLGWVLAAVTAASLAAPTTYAGRRQPINVGVVLLASQRTAGVPSNTIPHLWSVLDRDRAIKPAAWTLYNSQASSIVTSFVAGRWSALSPGTPSVGVPITKVDAPYWEVDLDSVSDRSLGQYDALAVQLSGAVSLNPRERERLRRFVDGGGLLWVDLVDGFNPTNLDLLNPMPLPFATNSAGTLTYNPRNPLVAVPNALSMGELAALYNTGSTLAISPIPGTLPLSAIQRPIGADSLRFEAVVGEDENSFVLGYARAGAGFVVISSRGVLSALNDGRDASGSIVVNRGFRSLTPAGTSAQRTAIKLMVNALSLQAQNRQEGGNSRGSGSIGQDLSAPLLRRFVANILPDRGTSAVHYKGRIVLVSGGRVVVLEGDPRNDLDLDGDPDDGVENPPGASYDLLWQSAGSGTTLSTPTVTETTRPNAGAQVEDVILVHQGPTGGVLQFPLNPASPSSAVAPSVTYAPPSASQLNNLLPPDFGPARPPAPVTVHEGLAFVSDMPAGSPQGRTWIIDLANQAPMRTGGRSWRVEGAPRQAAPDGPPTVGYIPIQDNSGGVDRVVYVPTAPDGNRSAGVVSLWLGARGESPANVQRLGNRLLVTTRAALSNLPIYIGNENPSLGVKISLLDINGTPYPASSLVNIFTDSVLTTGQNGVLELGLGGGAGSLVFSGAGQNAFLRIDYTVDWGAPTAGVGATSSESFIRGEVLLPDEPGNVRRVLGSVALAPNGNIFVVTAPGAENRSGGSLFAMFENGRGDFAVLTRWEAYDQFQFAYQQGTLTGSTTHDPSIVDYDGLLDILPPFVANFLRSRVRDVRFATGPVIRGNRVYAALTMGKNTPFGVPPFPAVPPRFVTALAAWSVDPSPLTIEVEGLTSNFLIAQPDPGRSTNKANVNQFSILAPGQFGFEQLSQTRGRATLTTLSSSPRGRLSNVIISNLPILFRRTGGSDILVQPELTEPDGIYTPGNARGTADPLAWYMVLNGFRASGNLFISGDTLFMGGGSFLPQLVNNSGGPPNFNMTDALLYAIDLRIGAGDVRSPNALYPGLAGPLRPWNGYVSTIDAGPASTVIPSPYVLFPSSFGIRSYDDFRIRVNQAVLVGNEVTGLTGGEGVLSAWTQSEFNGYARADLTVADAGRILQVDSNGFPLWATDSTTQSGREGAVATAGKVVRLSNASRAYNLGGNWFLIADPGNNRIVLSDASGRELRTLTRVNLDPLWIPIGTPDNPPLTLSTPRDVLTWTRAVPALEINDSVARGQLSPAFGRQLPGTAEYWVYYMIADAGNQRAILLVDRHEFDANRRVVGPVVRIEDPGSEAPFVNIAGRNRRLVPALSQLHWQLPAASFSKQFAYNSLDRRVTRNASGPPSETYLFGFGNATPSAATFGAAPVAGQADNEVGGGGIVLFRPDTGATTVITQVSLPAIPANAFYDPASLRFSSPARPAQTHTISGLRSATFSQNSGGPLRIMFTDSTGAYEIEQSGATWSVVWYLPSEAFTAMRFFQDPSGNITPTAKNPSGFNPTFARRLESGEVLIVNGYVGTHRTQLPVLAAFGINPGDPYGGEVVIFGAESGSRGFAWNRPNLGFDRFSIDYELPPVAGTRSLLSPSFADKR